MHYSLQAQSWDELRGLQAGGKIKVADAARQELQGRFIAVTERAISLETQHGAVEVDRVRVTRLQVRSSSRRARNILIGVGIGAAVGVADDQSVGRYLRNERGDQPGVRAVTYAAPIGLFAGIGAALSTYRTVYRAR